MDIIIYVLIFIIGTLFGSFFSLTVYRIPIKQSIVYGRSYCPKCNHRLKFLDLIPVLSYICLGGKCRYCKEKIRIRYLCLEVFSGITFLLFALSININIYNFEVNKLLYLVFGLLYISTLFIIGGIEKENHYIQNSVLLFGLICEAIYITYLYTVGVSIYKYVIYAFLTIVLILINLVLDKKQKKNYTLQILALCWYFAMFVKEETVVFTIILSILLIAIKQIRISISNNRQSIVEREKEIIPIGFYLCTCNIITLIVQNYIF